jgi:5-methylcytosine-specific restriction endonuclease McrA
MTSRSGSQSDADHLNWWKGKLIRLDDRAFLLPTWGPHILDVLFSREDNTVQATNLKQLALKLAVPLKFVPRAAASLNQLGIVTACLQSPAISIVLHRDRLPRRKIGMHRRRVVLSKIERESLKDQSDYRCACCGERCASNELALDHLIPLSLLGADHPANLVPMKKKHKTEKWDRFVRKDLMFYRGERVRKPVGVRFIDGAFWPVINGRLRRSRPST